MEVSNLPTLSFEQLCGVALKDISTHFRKEDTLFRLGRNTALNVGIAVATGVQPHLIFAVAATAALATLINELLLQILVTVDEHLPQKNEYNSTAFIAIGMLCRHIIPGTLFHNDILILPAVYFQGIHAWWYKKKFSARELRDYCTSFSIVGPTQF